MWFLSAAHHGSDRRNSHTSHNVWSAAGLQETISPWRRLRTRQAEEAMSQLVFVGVEEWPVV